MFGSKALVLITAVTATFISLANADAGGCHHCGQPCVEWTTVEKTIQVPQTFYEPRTIHTTEFRPETQEKLVTIYKRVPYTRQVEQCYRVMVPEHHTKRICQQVPKPVYREVTQNFTVCIPYQETHEVIERVCRMVPTTVMRKVCVDEGHWAEKPCNHGGGPGCCDHHHKVWVPNVVEREVECTVMRPTIEEVPRQCTVTKYRYEPRTRTVRVCDMHYETVERDVTYTTFRPEIRKRVVDVTYYDCVPEQVTKPCTVMVPHRVEKEVQVPVCRMVEKTVQVQVPVCQTCCH